MHQICNTIEEIPERDLGLRYSKWNKEKTGNQSLLLCLTILGSRSGRFVEGCMPMRISNQPVQ